MTEKKQDGPGHGSGAAEHASLSEAMEQAFRRYDAAPALLLAAGETVTYAELSQRVSAMAGALAEAGVTPGDRVTMQAEKSVEGLALYLATLKVGAVFNPLNPAYTPAELEHFLTDAQPALVAAPSKRLAEIGDLARRAGARSLLSLEADGSGTLRERASTAHPVATWRQRAPDDLAALVYTSGTTGRSKGAMITQRNLVSNAQTLISLWGLTAGETLIHALPIYHVHGLFVALNTALLGGLTLRWMERFQAQEVLAALESGHVIMGVPTFYTRLLAEPGLTQRACQSMRLIISGSAPLLPETHEAFRARTGHAILERYGMTETGMIASNPLAGDRVPGSVGCALPGVAVRVADATGKELPRGETGGVEVRGPNVFSGYWRLPERTRQDFRPDGWFITGDQGVMAADGRLSLVGRAKDLIITGGLNVYPIEVEQELNRLPAIEEAAVFGVPHPDFGEGVVAAVTTRRDAPPFEEASVLAALAQRLAAFKRPKRVLVVAELPRNSMGKVQKSELRRLFANLLIHGDSQT